VSDLLIGALGVLLSTNQPAALSNLVAEKTGFVLSAANPNSPVEQELRQVLAADDAAQAEVEKWLEPTAAPADPLLAPSPMALKARMSRRFDEVKALYESFLLRHPEHARGHLAYGSFLNDIGDEEGAVRRWEKSRELDPKNPAAWNNLANSYAHLGPVEKSFSYYEEALKLNPGEPIYWHNFGTLTFLYRTDATNYFKTDEQGVFRKALDMYQHAISLDPLNFNLLTDVAQTYYGVKPEPAASAAGKRQAELKLLHTALGAWTNALTQAPSDEDREGVYLHLARWHLRVGQFAEAQSHLTAVTNEVHQVMRQRLERNLAERLASKPAESAQ
jgi:tetratricopeptide (TPR) repeat protein